MPPWLIYAEERLKCTPLEFLDKYGFDNFKLAILGLNDDTVKAYSSLAIDFYDFKNVGTLSELIFYYGNWFGIVAALEDQAILNELVRYNKTLKCRYDYESIKNELYGVTTSDKILPMTRQNYMYSDTFGTLTKEELETMRGANITEEEVRLMLMCRG